MKCEGTFGHGQGQSHPQVMNVHVGWAVQPHIITPAQPPTARAIEDTWDPLQHVTLWHTAQKGYSIFCPFVCAASGGGGVLGYAHCVALHTNLGFVPFAPHRVSEAKAPVQPQCPNTIPHRQAVKQSTGASLLHPNPVVAPCRPHSHGPCDWGSLRYLLLHKCRSFVAWEMNRNRNLRFLVGDTISLWCLPFQVASGNWLSLGLLEGSLSTGVCKRGHFLSIKSEVGTWGRFLMRKETLHSMLTCALFAISFGVLFHF